MRLRPYQEAAATAAVAALRPALIAMPTGTGKTVVMAEIVRRLRPVAPLLIAHRRELLAQGDATVRRHAGQAIDVISVQALVRRLDRMTPPDLLLIDEAHHATAPTYRRVLDWASAAKVVGVTATPYRADEGTGRWELGHIFGERPVYTYPLEDAIRDGYLVPIRQWGIQTDVDLSDAKVRAGDLAAEALSLVDTEPRNLMVADAYSRLCEGRRAIVFAASIQHARHIREAFRAVGGQAEIVHGGLSIAERDARLDAYRRGDPPVIINVGILTEGFDDPETSAILMARPTRSRGLYVQCVGRGLRPAPDKTDCIVVDFLDRGGRHDVALQSAVRLAGVPHDVPIGLLDAGGRNIMTRAQEITAEILQRAEDLRRYAEVYPVVWAATDITPRWAREAVSLAGYEPIQKWQVKPPTRKQIQLIERMGLRVDDALGRSITRGEASHIIDRLLTLDRMHPEPATAKQIRFLRWKRIPFDDGLSKRDASWLIAQWRAQHGG